MVWRKGKEEGDDDDDDEMGIEPTEQTDSKIGRIRCLVW